MGGAVGGAIVSDVIRNSLSALVVVAVCASVGCWKRCSSSAAPIAAQTAAQTAGQTAVTAAPDVVVKDDSVGLVLSWIDEKGEFHVEEKVTDVPLAGRDAVRVYDPGRDEPHGEVVVADLRNSRADGTYQTKRMTRLEFDALAVSRREKNNKQVMPAEPGPVGGKESEGDRITDEPGSQAPNARRAAVIIYGAEWCGACHQAAAYLKRRGIPYVEKDIEADPSADREMRRKLVSAGMRGGSIPVLDVRGTILLGFDPGSIEAALGGRR